MGLHRGDNEMRRLIGLAVFIVLVLPAAALAQTTETFSFDIPDERIIDTTGSTHSLATVDVPEGLVGRSCLVESVADNNSSVHLNNNFIVSSGGGSVTLPNVERGSGAVTRSTDELTLGETVNVSLFLGNDDANGDKGIFSGGFTMNVICSTEPEPTPTPTPTPTPPPSPSPSPSPSETETPPPPDDGEVKSGGEVKSHQEVRGEDSGALPFTGGGIAGPLIWGVSLLGAGASALWVSRRK